MKSFKLFHFFGLVFLTLLMHQNSIAKEIGTASQWRTLTSIPAGIAGDNDLIFIGAPLEARVMVFQRNTRNFIGNLPAPANGFAVPFIIKSIGTRHIAVLDAGGLPSPNPYAPTHPIIYEYKYDVDALQGFKAKLVRTVSFDSVEIGFAEDFVRLSDNSYLLSDAILGAIWNGTTTGENQDSIVRAVLGPKSKLPIDQIPQLAMRLNMPRIYVDQIPFLFSGSALPGVGAMAVRYNKLYFATSATGSLYSIPLASLNDQRQPWQRAADIRTVSTKPANQPVEELLGLTFNPASLNSPYVYATDPINLRVIRIDVQHGQREVVASGEMQGVKYFNFPSSMAFLNNSQERALFVVSNQQHRTPLTNDAIDSDIFQMPFVITLIQGPRL